MTRIDGERRRPSGEKKEEKMCQCEAGLHKTYQQIGRMTSTVLQQPLSSAAVTALVCVCVVFVSVCITD